MCGRYVSKLDAAAERAWALVGPLRFESYNVAPTQKVPVVRHREGGPVGELIRWGLVPSWAKGVPPKLSTINARVETIATAASYRTPWKRGQRCVLLATGFYEWQAVGDRKQPWYIHLEDQATFGFAGLWDTSTTVAGVSLDSATIITMPANPLMAEIHNTKARMPAILQRDDVDTWLSGTAETAFACLQPYPEAAMAAYTVSTVVNSPKNNQPELIRPAPAVTIPP